MLARPVSRVPGVPEDTAEPKVTRKQAVEGTSRWNMFQGVRRGCGGKVLGRTAYFFFYRMLNTCTY